MIINLSLRGKNNIEYNVRIMRSLRNEVEQIWENAELRHFPHNPCYMTRTERSGVRVQRGANDSEQV